MVCIAVYLVREPDGSLWSARIPDARHRPELEHEPIAELLRRVATLKRTARLDVTDGVHQDRPIAYCCSGAYVDLGARVARVYACSPDDPERDELRVDRERRLADDARRAGWDLAMAWEAHHDLAALAGLPPCDADEQAYLDDWSALTAHSILTQHVDPGRFPVRWDPVADEVHHGTPPFAPVTLSIIDADDRVTTHALGDYEGLFAALGHGPALIAALRATPPWPGWRSDDLGAVIDVASRAIHVVSWEPVAPSTYAEVARRWPGWTVARERGGVAGHEQRIGRPGDDLPYPDDVPARPLRHPSFVAIDDDRGAAVAIAAPPLPADEAALLAAVEAEPDADGPRLVYADLLLGRGDPRGELIVVQCALAGLDETTAAPEARLALEVREHRLTSWAGAQRAGGCTARLDRGFLGTVEAYRFDELRRGDVLRRHPTIDGLRLSQALDATTARDLVELPGFTRLRALQVELAPGGVAPLVSAPAVAGLRRLDLGLATPPATPPQTADSPVIAHGGRLTPPASAAELQAALAGDHQLGGVTELRLVGERHGQDGIAELVRAARLPALTRLGLPTAYLGERLVDSLRTTPWLAGLTSLEVRLDLRSRDHLNALLTSSALPALRHLRVDWAPARVDAVVDALAKLECHDRIASLTIGPRLLAEPDRARLEARYGDRLRVGHRMRRLI